MKRTGILNYEIIGSACSWPVSVALSRNERSGTWTLYFRYTDPEYKSSDSACATEPEDFLQILEEHSASAGEFCNALVATGVDSLVTLASQIGAEAAWRLSGGKKVLLTREQSSMASAWQEHLCLESAGDGRWRLTTCSYEIIGSIYDLPQEDIYDEDGELKIPEHFNGRRVMGLSDGEWLESDQLVDRGDGGCEFETNELERAAAYCRETGWAAATGFPEAWKKLEWIA